MNANDQRVTDASTLRKLLNEIITVLEPVDSSSLYDDNIPRAIAARLERREKLENGLSTLIAQVLGVPQGHPSVVEYRRDKVLQEQIQELHARLRNSADIHQQNLKLLETIAKLDTRIADLELETSTPGMLHGIITRLVGVMGTLQIVQDFIGHQSHNPDRLAKGLQAMAPMLARRVTDWIAVRDAVRVYASIVASKVELAQRVNAALADPGMQSLFDAADLLMVSQDEAATPAAVENWMRVLADKKQQVLALRDLKDASLHFQHAIDPADTMPDFDDVGFFAPVWLESTATRMEVFFVLDWESFLESLEGIRDQRVFLTIFDKTLYFQTQQERSYWVMGMRQMMAHAGGMMPPYWNSTTHWSRDMPGLGAVLNHVGGEVGRLGAWDLALNGALVQEVWIGVIGSTVVMASPGGSAPYTRIDRAWQQADSWFIRPRGMGGREHSLPMQTGSGQ